MTAPTLLLVGAYVRRSDNATVTVRRINGTHDYVVDVNGARVDDTFTRAQAMRQVRS